MIASTFLITIVGTWVTEKIVAPRLGDYAGSAERPPVEHLTPRDRQHSLHYVGFNHEGLNVKEPWIFCRIYAVSLAVTLA